MVLQKTLSIRGIGRKPCFETGQMNYGGVRHAGSGNDWGDCDETACFEMKFWGGEMRNRGVTLETGKEKALCIVTLERLGWLRKC